MSNKKHVVPPLEYFSVSRVSILFGLEVSDLFQLIELCLFKPTVRINKYVEAFLKCDIERFNALEKFSNSYSYPETGIGFISNIRLEPDFHRAIMSKEIGIEELQSCQLPGYEILYSENLFHVPIEISGCWSPSVFFVDYSDSAAINLVVESITSFQIEKSDNYLKYQYEVSLTEYVNPDNVLLSRKDVLLLAAQLNSNKGFELDLHLLSHAQQKGVESTSIPRVTASQACMIKTLLQLIPDIDKSLFECPHKLHTKLQELCRIKRIPYTVNDGKTIKSWLDKAHI